MAQQLITDVRNADLTDLWTVLKDQHGRKVDAVAPASAIRSKDAQIILKGTEPELGENGVTMVDGRYRPTDQFDRGLSNKLRIPAGYLRMMRADRPDLYDANVNGWLRGKSRRTVAGDTEVVYPADERNFLIRCLRGDNGEGVARALLSDRYGVIDNLDAITAALEGVRQAGVEVEIDRGDLTDSHMYVRVVCKEVSALAPVLLKDYRSPFTGQSGTDCPVVFAGFLISNSEVGAGSFTITPQMVVQVCDNGLTIKKDAMRAVHLGSRLEEGVIRWSKETERAALKVITEKTADAVRTFLDVEYVTREIARMEEKAGEPITGAEANVKVLGKSLGFTEAEQSAVLDYFVKGGQLTRGGLVNAVTAFAQRVPNADRAHDLEAGAMAALDMKLATA